jgi:putative papain-like cysteine peptidase DUF1796
MLIDYNNFTNINNGDIIIINIAKLNINVMNVINKRFYKKIIIINCHHNDFWKKIKLLTNYKLINRIKFITKFNFITVNILIYKYEIPKFISLGNNCVVAHNLNQIGLRTEAYPFDWCRLTINKLKLILKNNFKDFTNLKIHKYSESHKSYLFFNKYKITFAHEVINNNIINFENKLKLRIERFYKLKNNNIYFVIFNEKNKSIDLFELILILNNHFNNYKILYISKIAPIYINKKIIYIDISKYKYIDWQYSNINWYDLIYNII